MTKKLLAGFLIFAVLLFSSCYFEVMKSMEDYIAEYAPDGKYYLLEDGKAFIDSCDVILPEIVDKAGAYPKAVLFVGEFDSSDISDMVSSASVIVFDFESDIKFGLGASVIESLFSAIDAPESSTAPQIIKESPYLIVKKQPIPSHDKEENYL